MHLKRGVKLLVFGEIHNVKGRELYVRQKLDQRHKVLVTRSNAMMLSLELGTKLSGRHLDIELFPFSCPEYLRFSKRKSGVGSFGEYVRGDGFPGYLVLGEKEVFRELVGDILYKDVVVRNGIRDVRPLQKLCSFLFCNVGNRVSPNRLKEALRASRRLTVVKYFKHLENAYLVQWLDSYSESVKARPLALKKIYVADTAPFIPTFHVREQNPSDCRGFARRSSLHGICRRRLRRFTVNGRVTRRFAAKKFAVRANVESRPKCGVETRRRKCDNMSMKTKFISMMVAAASVAAAFGGVLDNAWIQGSTDKSPIDYKVGEKMTFTLQPQDLAGAVPADEYFLSWTRSGDDGVRESGKVAFDGKTPFVYSTKIDKPGFVRLQAYVIDKNGKNYRKVYTGDTKTPEGKAAMNRFERMNKAVFFDGGAGADIETLRTEPEPKDFDAFWAKQFKRLDLVPIKADTIEIKCGNPKARLFAVRVDCAGLRPVTGYLSVPTAVDGGATFPARLETHGYSGDSCTHGRPWWVRDNEIVLNINAHGLKLVEFGATDADTKALRWETRSHDQIYAFDPKQNADPEVAYFNGMVLRVKRALQYLKTVKGWNGKELIASGGSQGGLQTIWAAACGEGVTRAESGITWCCDMYTSGKLRKDPALKLAADGWYIPWVDALGYYDAAIFGKRIPKSCRTVITRAGLGDYCCPPTGLAKLWNNIPGNKEVHWMQGSQHGYVPPKSYPGRDFVREVK